MLHQCPVVVVVVDSEVVDVCTYPSRVAVVDDVEVLQRTVLLHDDCELFVSHRLRELCDVLVVEPFTQKNRQNKHTCPTKSFRPPLLGKLRGRRDLGEPSCDAGPVDGALPADVGESVGDVGAPPPLPIWTAAAGRAGCCLGCSARGSGRGTCDGDSVCCVGVDVMKCVAAFVGDCGGERGCVEGESRWGGLLPGVLPLKPLCVGDTGSCRGAWSGDVSEPMLGVCRAGMPGDTPRLMGAGCLRPRASLELSPLMVGLSVLGESRPGGLLSARSISGLMSAGMAGGWPLLCPSWGSWL